MSNKSGIYKITDKHNGFIYIGSSKNIPNRWKQHKWVLNRGTHHSKHLQNSWNKYGADSFTWEILEECAADKETLLAREQHYIDSLNPQYNNAPKAGSRLGSKASDETKARMSASMKGKNTAPKSDETKRKLSLACSNPPEIIREKMRQSKLGTNHSEETKARMSAAHTGKSKDPKSIAKRTATRNAHIAEKRSTLKPTKELVNNDVRHMLRSFSDDDIRAIRASTDSDRQLGFQYSCSAKTISKIRNWLTYKDVK
jgi:group I intron endonuclease